MKLFELSNKANKDGKRRFKCILYRIYPDDCVDEEKEVGTQFNKNGITWIREYCEKALPSIKGMSLRAEFIDDERTELLGHGYTGVDGGEPTYEDAVVLGTFDNAYIDDVEGEDGMITACIGEGEIDAQCYHNFCQKLESDIEMGIFPSGSIEIMRTDDNDEIIYKYGYKPEGRIPMEFRHSGYALLGIEPADDNARLLELNDKHKEELDVMNELEIKNLVSQTVEEMSKNASKIGEINEACEAKIAEANEAKESAISEKNEIESRLADLQKELDDVREELNKVTDERNSFETALNEAKAKEKINEMNNALAEFTEEERAYAQAEIEAFKADPMNVEINSITDKIWLEIGKASKAKENEKAEEDKISEQNSANDIEDIFSEIVADKESDEDVNIF